MAAIRCAFRRGARGWLLLAVAALLLGAPGLRAAEAEPPFKGVVKVDRIPIRSGAGDFYPVGTAKRGDRVQVVKRITVQGEADWYQIEPPKGVYSFIPADYVEPIEGGERGRVTDPKTGIEAASVEGPAFSTRLQKYLEKGTVVEIVERVRDVYKIQPPEGTYVFIRATAVEPASAASAGDAGGAAEAAEGKPSGGEAPGVLWRHELGPQAAPEGGTVDREAGGTAGGAKAGQEAGPTTRPATRSGPKGEEPGALGVGVTSKTGAGSASAEPASPAGAGEPSAGEAGSEKPAGEATPTTVAEADAGPSEGPAGRVDGGEAAGTRPDAAGAPAEGAGTADGPTDLGQGPAPSASGAEAFAGEAAAPGEADPGPKPQSAQEPAQAPADDGTAGAKDAEGKPKKPDASAGTGDKKKAKQKQTPKRDPDFEPMGESEAVRKAERRLHRAMKKDLAKRPVKQLLARYRELEQRKSLSSLDNRIVRYRLKQLTRQREAKETLLDIREVQASIGPDTKPATKPRERRRNIDYDAKGLLLASAVYSGNGVPRLFRLVEPKTGHTIVYLEPGPSWNPGRALGRVVGVTGEPAETGFEHTRVLRVERLDVLGKR